MLKPLNGVRVLDFGQHGAGSACGRTLADWGADVIKVEAFRGCGSRFAGRGLGLDISNGENIHHDMINGGKRNIAIDVKTEKGKRILEKLLSQADIFFSNYRTRSLEKLGLDYASLSKRYPRLICGYLNAYGHDGPKVNDPGFDIAAYWAQSGMLLDCGTKEHGPTRSPFGGGDMMTGFALAAGMAACLYQQQVTGKGQAVYTSLFGTGIWQASNMIQAAAAEAVEYPRSEKEIGSPLANFFRSKDNEWFITATMDVKRQGPLMAKMIGRDDLAEVFSSYELMDANAEKYYYMFRDFYEAHDWAEIDQMLTNIDIVHNKLMHAKEIYHDEQALANHYIYSYTTRNGKTMPMVSTPVQFGDRELTIASHAPLIGEQTRDILQELDYSNDDIESLLNEHVVMETKYEG